MLYITTIRIISTETTEQFVKKTKTTATHLVEAEDELSAQQKVITFYQNLQTDTISHDVEFNSMHITII